MRAEPGWSTEGWSAGTVGEESAEAVRRMQAKGDLHAVGLATDDCHTTYEELKATGVEFIQEPSDRPYGVEAILRDSSGNWLVLVERKPYTGEDFRNR